MEKLIVGLVGASGAGKTTAANLLRDAFGFQKIQLGDSIKDLLRALNVEEINITGSPEKRKEGLEVFDGRSARYLMSTIGTDWGRNMVSPDIWVNMTKAKIKQSTSNLIVVDDIRYHNDLRVLQRHNFLTIKVRRSSVEQSLTAIDKIKYSPKNGFVQKAARFIFRAGIHESEYHWNFIDTDYMIWNDQDTVQFFESLKEIVEIKLDELIP